MNLRFNPYGMLWRADPVRLTLPQGTAGLAPLRAAVPRFGWSGEGCRGQVGEDRLRLRYQRPFYRNGMAPVLDARLVRDAQGAHLDGVYRMSTYARLFMTFWFSFLLLLTPMFLIAGVAGLRDGNDPMSLIFPIAPLLMLGFGLAFLNYGQRSWDDEKRLIEQWILQHLTPP